MALISLAGFSYNARAGEEGNIALIRLNGSIAESKQIELLNVPGITPKLVQGYLKKARQDNDIKAVVLRIDSPGGSVAASQEIAEMVRQFEKPRVVSMGDMAASGGYYISVYADKIVANPGTATGSIGVITQVIHFEGLLEKMGLKVETIKSGRHKDMGFRELTAEEHQILQDMCDEMYNEFVEAVAKGRNLDPDYVRQLATGQVYTGVQAVKLGLVDELGDLNHAIKLAADLAGVRRPVVEEYKPPTPLLERFVRILLRVESPFQLELEDDQLIFLRALEGWQAVPRY
jgi:protease-4